MRPKLWLSVLGAGAAVVLANIGARYLGHSFKYYFLGFLLLVWAILTVVGRYQEKALARELKALNAEDQEALISQLDPGEQKRIRSDMEK
jgi:hypothetical protein